MQQGNTVEDFFKVVWDGEYDSFKDMLPAFKKEIASIRNDRGQSILYCACRMGRIPIVAELLRYIKQKHINSPQEGSKLSTPLHAAAWGDHPQIVALLLHNGADIDVKNKDNRKPEDEAGPLTMGIFDKYRTIGPSVIEEIIPLIVKKEKKDKNISMKFRIGNTEKLELEKSLKMVSPTLSTNSSKGKPKFLPRSMNAPQTIAPTEWFVNIVGSPEPIFRKLEDKLLKSTDGYLELCNPKTGKITKCGKLLFEPVSDLLKNLGDSDNKPRKKVMFNIITREDDDLESIRFVDVAYYQSLARLEDDILFQVASNFNGIEAICEDLSPDSPSFTEQYIYDRTQGPIASVSAGGAAITRVHAAFYDPSKPSSQWCQTKERQLNTLINLKEYFPTNNGYITLTGKEPALPESEVERQKLFSQMFVCYHTGVEVTTGHRSAQFMELTNDTPIIDQVFCAAINIHQGGSGSFNKTIPKVEDRCQFILNTVYDSTYLSAISHKRRHLYLTLIGGGAFANEKKWIFSSILRSHLRYSNNSNSSLEKVTLILYRVMELEKWFLEELRNNKIPFEFTIYKNAQPRVLERFDGE